VKPKKIWKDKYGNGEGLMILPILFLILALLLITSNRSEEFRVKITNDSDSYIRVLVWFDGIEVIDDSLAPSGTQYYDIMDSSAKYTFSDYNGIVVTTSYSISPMVFTVPGAWGNGMGLEILYHDGGYITIEG
jgi:hypothetical protein